MAFEIGQRIGDYEILELLGSGGMGHVYRARNIISNRIEALKVLLPDLSNDRDLAVRFISEIRTLAAFDHPNIALLHTAFQTDNQLIMVMEYVAGCTLEHRAKQTHLTVPEISDYTSQALSALSYAHERNVVHRDIKPANLMVTTHGAVKLMDFGIAKSNIDINLTRPGTTIGSFYYMSPEQVRGSTVDGRSDLYSLGVVLYELLAGRRPFESDSSYGVLDQQLNKLPQPPIDINPSLSPQLNAIILRALAKDPAERFQTAEAFRDALKASRETTSPEAQPGSSLLNSAYNTTAPPAPVTPPFQEVPPPPSRSPLPEKTSKASRDSKPLWIATGALSAILAIVGLAIGMPHLFTAHASKSANTHSTPLPSSDTSTPTRPAPQADRSPQPSSMPRSAGSIAAVGNTPRRMPAKRYEAEDDVHQTPPAPIPQQPPLSSQPDPGPSQAELDQSQQRMVELGARSDTADRAVSILRSQQEANGLGLRSDIEAADSRLRSYMQAANRDLQAYRIASANRNMDKAEAEIELLEKFLGR